MYMCEKKLAEVGEVDGPAQKDSQHDLINKLRQWINRRLKIPWFPFCADRRSRSAVSGECLLLCVNREELNGSKGSGSVGLRFVSPTSANSVICIRLLLSPLMQIQGARKFVEKLRTELKVFVASVSVHCVYDFSSWEIGF